MKILPWILDFRLVDDSRDAPEGDEDLIPLLKDSQTWKLHSCKKWIPFWLDDKTGNVISIPRKIFDRDKLFL